MNDLGIIAIGIVILAIFGYLISRGFFMNADVHLALRIGMGVIGGGVLALVVRAIRIRFKRAKTEKAEEV